ncbi:beta-defensin 133 [Octodon degus]|uniref:Beta-defensin n=1 Tax=Octodon degus TaxID=10160 RepID=A0A6P6E5X5_OCTDE|nr:beta-defensin 133 [Octodon degus]
MKVPVLLFILFFFLDSLPPVKSSMKDTFVCFVKRGKCRHACHDSEKSLGFCTKLSARCCM